MPTTTASFPITSMRSTACGSGSCATAPPATGATYTGHCSPACGVPQPLPPPYSRWRPTKRFWKTEVSNRPGSGR